MVTYRFGTFETNSSSTHSMVICNKKEFDLWKKGEMFASRDDDKLITLEEAQEELLKYDPEYFDSTGVFVGGRFADTLKDALHYELGLYDFYRWGGELETDTTKYTSPSGDELVIVCRYGYDG